MRLNTLSPPSGSKKTKKRIGRGVGSGKGTTAGRGTKGQNSRSGGGVRAGFEGGQMPIHRRLPKRGFKNIFKKKYAIVNICDLERFESGTVVDEIALVRSGLVKGRRDGIKLLGKGQISHPLIIKVDMASQRATEKIIGVGGKVEAV